MNWFKGRKHEVRLKSQFVALDAENPISLISNPDGYLFNHTSDVNHLPRNCFFSNKV